MTIPSWLLDQIDLVVISPGVPTNTIPARYVDRKDGEVIGEVELAYRFMKGRIVGITGSNGKTTTTALIGEMLKNAGIPTQVGGNIGTPLLSLAETSTDDGWTVVGAVEFSAGDNQGISAECRDLPERDAESSRSVRRLSRLCGGETPAFHEPDGRDVAILNADDEITASWASGLKAKVVMFQRAAGAWTKDFFSAETNLICRANGKEKVLTTRDEIFLRGTAQRRECSGGVRCRVGVRSIGPSRCGRR